MTFTPTDGTDYVPVTITVLINVAQAAPQVSAKPVSLTYGTPLADSQLTFPATWTVGGAVVTVPGSWSYHDRFWHGAERRRRAERHGDLQPH